MATEQDRDTVVSVVVAPEGCWLCGGTQRVDWDLPCWACTTDWASEIHEHASYLDVTS